MILLKPTEIDQQELGELHQLINLHLYHQNTIIKSNLKIEPENENYEIIQNNRLPN